MTRGGKRRGAGRPKGTGKFGEPTKAVRLPVSYVDRIMSFIERKGMVFPLYETKVQAGYPSPVDDASAEQFDLSAHLIPRPASTYFVRVNGDSMIGAGIYSDDILIVDRSIEAKNGDIIVAIVEDDFTVKRLIIKNKKYELKPENSKFSSIKLADSSDLKVWGVVRYVIHKV